MTRYGFGVSLIGTAVLLLLCLVPLSARGQFFTINSFDSDIAVNTDGSIEVTETIRLTFEARRHGIYRDLPLQYSDAMGNEIVTPVRIKAITDESGRPRNYRVKRDDGVMRVRIGRQDRYVDGSQVYVIRYRVKDVVSFFDDHDEIYWNVTGNGWQAPIGSVTARLVLVTDSVSKRLATACYTGRYGSHETACESWSTDNGAGFATRRPLDVGEGLTVAFGFDKGIITPATELEQFSRSVKLSENWGILMPVTALLVMLLLWFFRGRDPGADDAESYLNEPPSVNGQYLNAAEVGTMIDDRLDQRDISGAIVGLAVRGYLRIEESGPRGDSQDADDFRLIKVRDVDNRLTSFERRLMEVLFRTDTDKVWITELQNRFYRHLGELNNLLFADLVDKRYYTASPPRVRRCYFMIAVAVLVLGSVAVVTTSLVNPLKGVFWAMLAAGIIALFAIIMPARTREGARARVAIRHFQEFLLQTDRTRLGRSTDGLFYRFLPYAVALDVTNQWARAFKDIYKGPPDWYVMPNRNRPGIFTLSTAMNRATCMIGASVFSAPRGSGSSTGGSGFGGGGGFSGGGGGGFSGGGSGGGGGGSW